MREHVVKVGMCRCAGYKDAICVSGAVRTFFKRIISFFSLYRNIAKFSLIAPIFLIKLYTPPTDAIA